MKKREQKKRDRKKWEEQRRQERKRSLEHVLSRLALLEGFRDLPAPVRQQAIQMLPSGPVVVIEPSARGRPDTESLKKDLEEALERAFVETDDGEITRLADFLAVYSVFPGGFACLDAAPLRHKQSHFLEKAAARMIEFRQEWDQRIQLALDVQVMDTLLSASRIDQGVFGCVLNPETPRPGKPVFRLSLVRSAPRESRVALDGKVRPVFQCGLPEWTNGIRWMQADGERFGLDRGRKYPLSIQSHALRKLEERFPADRDVEVIVRFGLLESLRRPEVVERRGETYLIAYHVHGVRLGYLVARVAQCAVVITTFLFLTMEGTPEFRLLKEKLRLCRRDLEHLSLDRLETFLGPDVLQDQGLVTLLEECGCGSLLGLARDGFPYDALTGRAEELRRFLRIEECDERRSGRLGPSRLAIA
jgi:hypothetical protein